MKKQLRGIELEEYKKKLVLTSQQQNIIVGTLLGDATLSAITKGMKTCNLKYDQSIANIEYINHLYGIFKDWCGSEPRIRQITGGYAKDRQSISFKTYRHPALLFYYGQYYNVIDGKRKKVVPELLPKWLNDEVLAYWFMDDGSRQLSGYTLHTENYEYHEQVKLAKMLGQRFNLQVSIHRDRSMYRLYVGASGRKEFTKIVSPYMMRCFDYKLHQD